MANCTNSSARNSSGGSTRKPSSDRFPRTLNARSPGFAIAEELARLCGLGFDLKVSEEAFEFLVRRGIHKALRGAPAEK